MGVIYNPHGLQTLFSARIASSEVFSLQSLSYFVGAFAPSAYSSG